MTESFQGNLKIHAEEGHSNKKLHEGALRRDSSTEAEHMWLQLLVCSFGQQVGLLHGHWGETVFVSLTAHGQTSWLHTITQTRLKHFTYWKSLLLGGTVTFWSEVIWWTLTSLFDPDVHVQLLFPEFYLSASSWRSVSFKNGRRSLRGDERIGVC